MDEQAPIPKLDTYRPAPVPAFGLVVGEDALVILTDGRVFRYDPSTYDRGTGPGWEEFDPIPGTEVAVAEAAERLRLMPRVISAHRPTG